MDLDEAEKKAEAAKERMKRLQMAGNLPIALIGGGTTMIGDPSGRTDMRKMLTGQNKPPEGRCMKPEII